MRRFAVLSTLVATLSPASLALAEHVTPCRKGDAWTSEDATERAEAVEGCRACPIVTTCHDAAESTREAFGVWGGIDRTKTAREQRARHTA